MKYAFPLPTHIRPALPRFASAVTSLLVAVLNLFAAIQVKGQEARFSSPQSESNQGGEEAVVRRVVNGIMQPYLAQRQRTGARGQRWVRSSNLGAIVAVSLRGRRYFFAYGKATDSGAPFTRDTLLEIGSCTKVFTTTLFALGINRNQIAPDDPAQKYMPDGYTLRAQQLTPLELADFTSGMPDDPTNLPRDLEQRSIQHYTVRDFLTWASNYEPRTRLPAPYKYSNAGIGLLSYLLETASGKSWEDQVNSEIFQPLSMPDTTLRPTPEQEKRLAQGHTRTGQNAPRWLVYAWYAAGGLRSTAHDMISFGEANLGHQEVNGKRVSAELIAAMQLAQKPIYTIPKGVNKQAMAWMINMGDGNPNLHPVIVKNGGTSGFGSVIAVNPTKDAAIFIGMNQVGAQPAVKGIEILRKLP
ncbi:MAG TPA: serine hydrolase [Candidatus Udaeobacter sp.]|nr:serine hydrolase [Candidatus Udaeobacter sp.]